METLLQDLRFALRQLRKTSGFTVVVVITLALGIGANTAFFGVLNATLFRPLPYSRPGQLVHIHERMLKSDGEMPVAYPDFVDWKRQQTSFSALAIYRTDASLNLTTSTGTDRVPALLVDHDFLKVLGTQLESGRDFTANDDRLGAPLTALITHAAWAKRFNSDPAILGRTLTVDGKSTTIIGILPQGFQFFSKCELIEPLGPSSSSSSCRCVNSTATRWLWAASSRECR
jgi:putative ABC transport system permease protein